MSKYASALERQLRMGFRRLRFKKNLEQLFREDYADRVLAQRLVLLIVGAVLVSAAPLLDGFLLHPPREFEVIARRVQFGIILPALLLAFAFTAERRLRRWADPLGIGALFVVIAGWVYLRHLGVSMGYEVPEIVIGVIIAGTFAIAGIAFWMLAPVAVAGLLMYCAVEIYTYGTDEARWWSIGAQCALALVTALGGYLSEFQARHSWLREMLLKELSERDALTDLLNPRAFEQAFTRILAIASREGRPLLVAAIDVDFFKPYNDRYGHQAGDVCLKKVAAELAASTRRAADLVARTGGEEFTIIWYDLPCEAAQRRITELRKRIEELEIPHLARGDWSSVVTISVGAMWQVPSVDDVPVTLLKQADHWLYESKHQGRNRVTFEIGSGPSGPSRPKARLTTSDESAADAA